MRKSQSLPDLTGKQFRSYEKGASGRGSPLVEERTLQTVKDEYENNGIAKIAVLGAARKYPGYSNNTDEVLKKLKLPELSFEMPGPLGKLRDILPEDGDYIIKRLICEFEAMRKLGIKGIDKELNNATEDLKKLGTVLETKDLRRLIFLRQMGMYKLRQKKETREVIQNFDDLYIEGAKMLAEKEGIIFPKIHAREYISAVTTQLDTFITKMDKSSVDYTMLNGGWEGNTNAGSVGVPLIANVMGVTHDYDNVKFGRKSKEGKEGESRPPITIMPEGGAHDKVMTPGEDVYFEVPGVWGDDSPYLIGMSDLLIVCAPFGAWTEIEIANGIAQNKPIAFLLTERKTSNLISGPSSSSSLDLLSSVEYSEPLKKKLVDYHKKEMVEIFSTGEDLAEWCKQKVEKLTATAKAKQNAEASSSPPPPSLGH